MHLMSMAIIVMSVEEKEMWPDVYAELKKVTTYQVYLRGNIICGVAAVHLAFLFFLIKDFSVCGVSITFNQVLSGNQLSFGLSFLLSST